MVAAAREAWEETGIDPSILDPRDMYADDHGNWCYFTVIAHAKGEVHEFDANAETEDLRWVPIDNVGGFDLHPGLRATWPTLIDRVKATLDA